MYLFQLKFFNCIQILFLLKLSSINNFELGEGNYKVIYIQQKIIYINSSEDDYNIYYHDETNIINLHYYTDIKKNKDIVKIDEEYF